MGLTWRRGPASWVGPSRVRAGQGVGQAGNRIMRPTAVPHGTRGTFSRRERVRSGVATTPPRLTPPHPLLPLPPHRHRSLNVWEAPRGAPLCLSPGQEVMRFTTPTCPIWAQGLRRALDAAVVVVVVVGDRSRAQASTPAPTPPPGPPWGRSKPRAPAMVSVRPPALSLRPLGASQASSSSKLRGRPRALHPRRPPPPAP